MGQLTRFAPPVPEAGYEDVEIRHDFGFQTQFMDQVLMSGRGCYKDIRDVIKRYESTEALAAASNDNRRSLTV